MDETKIRRIEKIEISNFIKKAWKELYKNYQLSALK